MKKIFALSCLVLIIIIFFINSQENQSQECPYITVDNKSDSNLKVIWTSKVSGGISSIKKIANYGFVPANSKVIVMLPPKNRNTCTFSVRDISDENKTGRFHLSLDNICPIELNKTYEISNDLDIILR